MADEGANRTGDARPTPPSPGPADPGRPRRPAPPRRGARTDRGRRGSSGAEGGGRSRVPPFVALAGFHPSPSPALRRPRATPHPGAYGPRGHGEGSGPTASEGRPPDRRASPRGFPPVGAETPRAPAPARTPRGRPAPARGDRTPPCPQGSRRRCGLTPLRPPAPAEPPRHRPPGPRVLARTSGRGGDARGAPHRGRGRVASGSPPVASGGGGGGRCGSVERSGRGRTLDGWRALDPAPERWITAVGAPPPPPARPACPRSGPRNGRRHGGGAPPPGPAPRPGRGGGHGSRAPPSRGPRTSGIDAGRRGAGELRPAFRLGWGFTPARPIGLAVSRACAHARLLAEPTARKPDFVHLRYFLGGERPIQTPRYAGSTARFPPELPD